MARLADKYEKGPIEIKSGPSGYFDPEKRVLVLESVESKYEVPTELDTVSTNIHEMGHSIMHDIGDTLTEVEEIRGQPIMEMEADLWSIAKSGTPTPMTLGGLVIWYGAIQTLDGTAKADASLKEAIQNVNRKFRGTPLKERRIRALMFSRVGQECKERYEDIIF